MKTRNAVLLSVGAVAAAAGAGASFGPQTPRNAVWYARLRKPAFTPSGATIGMTWTTLEVLLCLAGARLMRDPPTRARNGALTAWWGILVGLAGYPAAFFGWKRLGPATAVSAGMLAAASVSVAKANRADRTAAASLLPIVAWLGFATLLSADVWRRNAGVKQA